MRLKGQKILIFVGDNYEEMELFYPKYRLEEEGVEVVVAGKEAHKIYFGKKGHYPCKADVSFDQVDIKDFHGVVIPGGYMPDKLRLESNVLKIVRECHETKKLIAFICHGGWVPISAKVLKGVKCTSYVAIKDDMVNAGAHWEDASVVVDNHFISSRTPKDLPSFGKSMIEYLSK